MAKDKFETKIIQDRVLAEERCELESDYRKRFPSDIVNNLLSWYDNKFNDYESSLKESSRSLSFLDFRKFLRESEQLNPQLYPFFVKYIKEKYTELALYDASYEYLDSDENYDASKAKISPLLVTNINHK